MARPNEDVPEAELAVLRVLWQVGEATRRQVAEALYPGGGASKYATVQKLLERLVECGLVRQGGTERRRTFTAALTRDELLGRRLGHLADGLCDGALVPLVQNLVRVRPLTAAELDELRAFVREQSAAMRKGQGGVNRWTPG